MELQKEIKEIYKDTTLTPKEKSKRVQELYKKPKKEELPPCTHYIRGCAIQPTCCDRWYSCRLCHDADQDHIMDRFKTQRIRCVVCLEEQAVGNQCVKCETTFAKYFCEKCRLWTDKESFHCDECGLCRRGNRDTIRHCKTCNACYPTDHTCKPTAENNCPKCPNCPICFDDLFISVIPWITMHCGHSIHTSCFKTLLEKGNYRCPLCKKSTVDMSSTWERLQAEICNVEMPHEYKDTKVNVQCNDCSAKSETAFHVVGLQCLECKGFNTSRI